jgi:hypothetical protein
MNLYVVSYGYKIRFLMLREEYVMIVFENRVMSKIFVLKREEVTGERRKWNNKEVRMHPSPAIFRVIKPRRMRWAGHYHVGGRGEVHSAFWWGNMREGDNCEA